MSAVEPSLPRPSLRGATVAFTGKLLSMSPRQAHEIVERAAGRPMPTVSRRTSMLVVGMGGRLDGPPSFKLRQAEALNARGARIRIISEQEFLEQIGSSRTYTAAEVCELTGIGTTRLRRMEQTGRVNPRDGRYDFRDLIAVQEELNRSLIRPRAQLPLDFDDADAGADAVAPALRLQPPEPRDAAEWFDRAQILEEEEQFTEAAQAYRKAIALDPALPEAFFNLGNVLRCLDRPDAALEMFEIAVALDPQLTEAWYNIADIHEERGRLEDAVASLRKALDASAAFADAYYNLALCYEKLGDVEQSRRCWAEYIRLDPDSEWSLVARRRLAGVGA